MTAVMIGVDPHKASHMAVAIDAAEAVLGELRVRASAGQAGKLLEWAADWPDRTWAVEGAGGLGHVPALGGSSGPIAAGFLRPVSRFSQGWLGRGAGRAGLGTGQSEGSGVYVSDGGV